MEQFVVKTPEDVGRVIRQVRKRNNLRQADLAGVLFAGHRLVSEIERGKKTTQIGRVMEALGMLGLDIILVDRSTSIGDSPYGLDRSGETKE
ncbi:MAG: helix-turn-helix domain-containing protein [Leptospirales bacterium]